eukprot:5509-Heterococcus_DN1.PRE.2
MVHTRRQKQALAAVTNPLKDAGILQQVFTYLPGNWLFLGAVCSEWRVVYVGVADQQLRSIKRNIRGEQKLVTCSARTTLFSAAVASSMTAVLTGSCGLPVNDNLQRIAGWYADIETSIVLRELGMPLSELAVKAAATAERLDILQSWLSEPECPKPATLGHNAANGGSISILRWLKAEGWCAFDKYTCASAALGGHLAALQFFRSEGCAWSEHDMLRFAARSGSVELVDWLRQQQGIVMDARAMSAAASRGLTAMCAYLRSISCEWPDQTCDSTATHGHLDTLRWLRTNGCPCSVRRVCVAAATNGFTDILDYLINDGEALDADLLTDALNGAGSHSKLQAAQWLRQHGAQWPAVLTYGEGVNAKHWSDDMIAWARAEGCTSPTAQ